MYVYYRQVLGPAIDVAMSNIVTIRSKINQILCSTLKSNGGIQKDQYQTQVKSAKKI